ncbi:MAG: 4-(cytidine 5'-diphospho)-2-C-methyl-D-erythritol kinase [Hyphomicrobiaceae bacterium]
MQPIAERAPPKVNLTLRVLGRRPDDGYHELDSLVAFAHDVADSVTFTPGPSCRVTTTGPFGGSIAGENLISVTLARIAHAAPHLTLGSVQLEKNLPIAAGIGGGSADAAAVIRAVQRANPQISGSNGIDWTVIATGIGADVPVCLASSSQRMTGIGDQLTAIQALPELSVVLVNPQAPVPPDKTAQVFRKRAAPTLSSLPPAASPIYFESRAALLGHMHAVGNDLLTPARFVVPAIDAVLAALSAQPSCELAQLSGGGPTCFGIFPDMTAAHIAAAALSQSHPSWWIRASSLS